MLDIETDQNFNILLANIKFVLRSNNLEVEVGDGASESEPSGGCSNSIGDSLSPSAVHEGVALEVRIYSGDRDGQFRDEWLERDDSSVAYLYC